MQKSFVERIFPSPSQSEIRHARSYRDTPSLPTSPSPSSSRRSSSPHRAHQPSPLSGRALQSPPLSSSTIHFADPLLPIDRATKSLERTIQSLLDSQSEGLLAGLGNGLPDEVSSAGSLTPTPSASTPSRRSLGPKVVPVRQPTQKPITLRGARRGLTKSMRDFALLKDEEVKILETQYHDRDIALQKARAFEDKRTALENEARAIQTHENTAVAARTTDEAHKLDLEIKQLEGKLMEMKARHRHLLSKSSQLESSVDAKLSSYKSSIKMVDMEIRRFLRRPPVQQGLPPSGLGASDAGMYALKPERRTLEMAKEQWKSEQELLAQRRENVEDERHALQAGGRMWHDAVQRITEFEKILRAQTTALSQSQLGLKPDTTASITVETMYKDFSTLIVSLETDLAQAEASNWNLIICALGAELEALRQGRTILEQMLGIQPDVELSTNGDAPKPVDDDQDDDEPDEDLIRYGGDANGGVLHSPSASSNRSFEDTLEAFGDGGKKELMEIPPSALSGSKGKVDTPETQQKDEENLMQASGSRHQRQTSKAGFQFGFGPTSDSRSDTEDDEPGPDFYVSHS